MAVTIHGTVAPGFEPVRDAFRDNFDKRGEIGASVCIYREGEPIVDLWAGLADRATQRPWDADTLTIVFSSTKGMAALAMMMLADRGQLDYDRRVAEGTRSIPHPLPRRRRGRWRSRLHWTTLLRPSP